MYDDFGFYIGDGGLDALYNGGWDFPMDSYAWDVQAPTMNTDLPIAPGTPGWDEGYSDTLGGGMPSQESLSQLQSAGSDNNAAAIARMQADVAAGRAPNPQDLGVMYANFGIPYSNRDLGLPRFGSLGNLLRGGAGESGGGRGFVNMPRIDSPVADRIAATPVPAMRDTPAPPAFTPLQIPNAAPPREDTDLRGLARLLQEARR